MNNWPELQELIKTSSNAKYCLDLIKKDISTICPTWDDIFKVFSLIKPEDVKVIIVGQDPYPKPNQATGIGFGTKGESTPSLTIIEKELIDSLGGNQRLDYTLNSWVKQGVLLLNRNFTCNAYNPGSHSEAWKNFGIDIFKSINNSVPNATWMLWGNQVQQIESHINTKTNTILKAPHPVSEHYAMKNNRPSTGFLGCNHFKLTEHLINW